MNAIKLITYYFKLLVGWSKREVLYLLTIEKLAKKYLPIHASTAPSERVFSVAKNILTK